METLTSKTEQTQKEITCHSAVEGSIQRLSTAHEDLIHTRVVQMFLGTIVLKEIYSSLAAKEQPIADRVNLLDAIRKGTLPIVVAYNWI
jgi:hypothetical protein